MERTWPNVLTYEAVLNQEYNKWQPPGVRGTPPEHNLDVAFVRMLAGPLDYHQGGMRSVLPEDYRFRDKAPPVQGTRGHQLAMYVVYQNHLPMMADYPVRLSRPAGAGVPRRGPDDLGRDAGAARRDGPVPRDRPPQGGRLVPRRDDGRPRGGSWTCRSTSSATARSRPSCTSTVPAGGPTSITRREQTVSAADTLRVVIPRAGGFAARLSRTEL